MTALLLLLPLSQRWTAVPAIKTNMTRLRVYQYMLHPVQSLVYPTRTSLTARQPANASTTPQTQRLCLARPVLSLLVNHSCRAAQPSTRYR